MLPVWALGEQTEADLSYFKVSLIYVESFGTAKSTRKDSQRREGEGIVTKDINI